MKTKLAIGLLVLSPAVAVAEVIRVEPDGSGDAPNIQAAVDIAKDGDVIELGVGTFRGDGNRDIELLGKRLVVRGAGYVASTIDCEGTSSSPHRGFAAWNAEPPGTAIQDMTIVNAYGLSGAGILVDQSSSVVVNNCRVASGTGPGIVFTGSSSGRIESCIITGMSGSGIVADAGAALTVEGSTVSGNLDDTAGGALYAAFSASVQVERSIFWGNCSQGAWDEVRVDLGAVVEFACSIVPVAAIGGDGDIVDNGLVDVDPEFCAAAECLKAPSDSGNYGLREGSIASSKVSPCGEQIGALDVACDGSVPSRRIRWSSLKQEFKD